MFSFKSTGLRLTQKEQAMVMEIADSIAKRFETLESEIEKLKSEIEILKCEPRKSFAQKLKDRS